MSDLLNQASLVMVPSGYKEDKVYSVVPSDGSGDLSFTRASNGTRVNSAGLVEVVPWNLLEQSNNFSISASWLNDGTTETGGQAGYDGTNNAWLLIPSTIDTYHTIKNSFSEIGVVTYSVYAKAQTYNGILFFSGQSGNGKFFNLSNGTLGDNFGTGLISSSIESVGNGWYRCSMTVNRTAAGTFEILVSSDGISTYSFAGNGTGGVFIQNAQANIGATAKPYFPTTDRLNVPRLTYQNGGGGCPSLLLEKQSTNLYPYSEDLTQWTTSGSPTITGNNATSPDGTTNADRVQFSGSGDLVYNSGTGSAGTNVLTVYAKAKTGTAQKFRFFANGATLISSDFTATDQWQRFEFVYTYSNQTAGLQGASTGASDVLFWGFQHEVSSYATSYIQTQASSATRVADACFKTGISSLIGQTEGTLFFEGSQIGAATSVPFQLSDTTNANRVQIEIGSTGVPLLVATSAGVNVAIITGSSYTIGQNRKIAVTYKNNDFRLYQNGVLIGSDTSGSVPVSLTAIYLGSEVGVPYPNLEIKQIVNFKTSLSDAECIALTTL